MPNRWFAWYPVRIEGEGMVWLKYVGRTWAVEGGQHWGSSCGHSGRDDGWVYTADIGAV